MRESTDSCTEQGDDPPEQSGEDRSPVETVGDSLVETGGDGLVETGDQDLVQDTSAVFERVDRESSFLEQVQGRLQDVLVEEQQIVEKRTRLESLEESAVEGEHVGGCQGPADITPSRDMTINLVSDEQQDWDLNDKTFSESNVSPLGPPGEPAGSSTSSTPQTPAESETDQSAASDNGECADVTSHVSSATNVTPIESLQEEPEYEIPMSFHSRENDVTPREPSRSPIYSTVLKPARLKLSQSMSTRAGTLSPGSGVVSYASTTIIPAHDPVSDYPISKQFTLDWVPRVPKKQRCVQVI